jgi:hypothetical protein
VNEKVYIPKVKAKTTKQTKQDLIDALSKELGAAEGQLQTLEKASKEALEFLTSKVVF